MEEHSGSFYEKKPQQKFRDIVQTEPIVSVMLTQQIKVCFIHRNDLLFFLLIDSSFGCIEEAYFCAQQNSL